MSTKSRVAFAALALLALGSLYFGGNVEGNKSLDCEGGIPFRDSASLVTDGNDVTLYLNRKMIDVVFTSLDPISATVGLSDYAAQREYEADGQFSDKTWETLSPTKPPLIDDGYPPKDPELALLKDDNLELCTANKHIYARRGKE